MPPLMLTSIPAILAVAATIPQTAAQEANAPSGQGDVVTVDADGHSRYTVAVRIGESGPLRFLIDTGAERTVVSRSVADRLNLVPAGRATLVGIAGSIGVDLVEIDEVVLGRRSFYGLTAPVLERYDIGADGIIGIDGLQDQRVLLDFGKGTMEVNDARSLGGDRGYEIIVRARRRSGQLIMTNALVDGIKTAVVIDTGAQFSIGNRALQRALAKRRQPERTSLSSVTGQSIPADLLMAREVEIGDLHMANTWLAFADAPPFKSLDLDKQPALLMGMNELRAFSRVAIDFDTRKVMFDLPARQPG
ncbi:aspartyl protease family protein [Novosphingobium tardum]|uniref:Aspartyl protease family protein n=1 Tax=Novosphingobium tardum TaxID=1538021 RepID=A0ABV8RRP3_9SPHN